MLEAVAAKCNYCTIVTLVGISRRDTKRKQKEK
jgi:hypothetical protein